LLAAVWISSANPALAHDIGITRVQVTVDSPRTCSIDMFYDVDAWVVGGPAHHLTSDHYRQLAAMTPANVAMRLDELRDHLIRNIRIRFDEKNYPPAIEFIDNPEYRASSQPVEGSTARRIIRMTVAIPEGARAFDFWASRSFGNIMLLIRRAGETGGVQQLLERGERSRPYALSGEAETTRLQTAGRFLALGFTHIVPYGADHILFVLGLFLLSTKLGPLLWQVSAFTIAHTLTLGLSMYGVFSLSPRIVEPLIALSIAAVAIENVCTTRLHAWRPIIVFCFGLLHGMGFAGALLETGLPRNQFVVGLASFNVGVEFGQLTVIAAAFLLVSGIRNKIWYRRGVVVPASLLIAAIGLFWTFQRALG